METESVLLIRALADVRDIFRDLQIAIGKNVRFSRVDCSLLPFAGRDSMSGEERLTLTFAIDAELANWVDKNQKSVGLTLEVRYFNGSWVLEGEYGWSGQEVGWDAVHSVERMFETSMELLEVIHEFALELRESSRSFFTQE